MLTKEQKEVVRTVYGSGTPTFQMITADLALDALTSLREQYETRGLYGPYFYQGRKRHPAGTWYVWCAWNDSEDNNRVRTLHYYAMLPNFLDIEPVVADFIARGAPLEEEKET